MKNQYTTSLTGKLNSALFLMIMCLFININSNKAQSWQWAKGGGGSASDNASKTCVDPSGNVFVAGTFNSTSINIGTITVNNAGASGFDVYVAKFNPAGVVQWVSRIGGSSSESVAGLSCDNAGRVYVYGGYNSPTVSLPPFTYGNLGAGTYNVFLACIDASGVAQWLNGYGGTGQEFATGCVYTGASSSIFITGTYFDPTFPIGTYTLNNTSATGKAEVFIAKINNAGTLVQWASSTGSSGCDDYGGSIATDASGGPYIFGSYQGAVVTPTTMIGATVLTSFGNQDMYLAKYTNVGAFQWARDLGSSQGGDYPGGCEVDAANNVYLAGYYQNASLIVGTTTLTSVGGYDAFIAKYNSAGVAQWAQKITGTNDEYGYDVSVDASSNAYIAGTFAGTVITTGTSTLSNSSPGNSTDVFAAKFNTSGVCQWITGAGGAGNESGSGIVSDPAGNVYVAGSIGGTSAFSTTTLTTAGGVDLFVGKIGCLTTSVSGVSNVCAGSSATLTASGGANYSWSTGGTTPSIIITPTATANYTVTASNTGSTCVGTPAVISVTVLPSSLNLGANLNLLCKQKQQIAATCNPASPTSVVWSPTVGLSSGTILTPTATGGSPTTYTCNVTLNNGCLQTKTISVSSYAQTPDICMVTVDSLGNNNEIYWDKTSYPEADSFIVYREVSLNTYKRIGGISRTQFSMYTDTNRSIGPANGNPSLTYYKYKMQIKDSCGNTSPMSKWHETIFIQDQMNGNFNWNPYAIELASPPVSLYNLKRRDLTTGTETLVASTVGALATDPAYNTFWPTNTKWFVDAIGFNCNPTPKGVNNNNILVLKTKTKSNQSNDKQFPLSIANQSFASNNVKVYPNPAKESLSVDVDIFNKENVSVEIQNMFGQVIYQNNLLSQHNVINTSLIADGVYMVNVKHNDKIVAIKKVVINN